MYCDFFNAVSLRLQYDPFDYLSYKLLKINDLSIDKNKEVFVPFDVSWLCDKSIVRMKII